MIGILHNFGWPNHNFDIVDVRVRIKIFEKKQWMIGRASQNFEVSQPELPEVLDSDDKVRST
jgi:hypothetical protein